MTRGWKDIKLRWLLGEKVANLVLHNGGQDAILEAWAIVKGYETRDSFRAWMQGTDPYLGERCPVLVAEIEPEEVIRAARNWIANG